MTTTDSHSSLSRYALACAYSCSKPNVVRSPEQITISGPSSLISLIARSSRFGTKSGPPQWMSEVWAIVKAPPFRLCIWSKCRTDLENADDRPVQRGCNQARGRDRQQPGADNVA